MRAKKTRLVPGFAGSDFYFDTVVFISGIGTDVSPAFKMTLHQVAGPVADQPLPCQVRRIEQFVEAVI